MSFQKDAFQILTEYRALGARHGTGTGPARGLRAPNDVGPGALSDVANVLAEELPKKGGSAGKAAREAERAELLKALINAFDRRFNRNKRRVARMAHLASIDHAASAEDGLLTQVIRDVGDFDVNTESGKP